MGSDLFMEGRRAMEEIFRNLKYRCDLCGHLTSRKDECFRCGAFNNPWWTETTTTKLTDEEIKALKRKWNANREMEEARIEFMNVIIHPYNDAISEMEKDQIDILKKKAITLLENEKIKYGMTITIDPLEKTITNPFTRRKKRHRDETSTTSIELRIDKRYEYYLEVYLRLIVNNNEVRVEVEGEVKKPRYLINREKIEE